MTPWAKRLAIALALSIGVNLLFAGYVLGFGLHGPRAVGGAIGMGNGPGMGMGRGMGRGSGMGMGHGMGSGTGCRRPALRTAIELRGNDVRACRQDIDKARDTVRVVLGHEPLDRAALEQALATLRAQSGRGQELTHQAIVEAATRAAPEQRHQLADEFGSANCGM